MKGIVLLAIAAAACTAAPPADREARLARLAAQRLALADQLDDLQARLIVDRHRVQFWEEMRERHESISAISCSSQEAHAVAMAERLLPAPRARELEAPVRVRARVASARQSPGRAQPKR